MEEEEDKATLFNVNNQHAFVGAAADVSYAATYYKHKKKALILYHKHIDLNLHFSSIYIRDRPFLESKFH